jgi:tRNA-dihydrouridine synthase
LYMQLHGATAPLEPLKKHFKGYVNNIPGAPGLRAKLMHFTDYEQLERILQDAMAVAKQ